MIEIEQFGKDHWSLLAYVEARYMDNRGILDHRNMRCNIEKHPLFATPVQAHFRWRPEYGTKLKDGTRLEDHDDWDCLEDLERAGLVEIISMINGFVRLTPRGKEIACQLRLYKLNGGNYAEFSPA